MIRKGLFNIENKKPIALGLPTYKPQKLTEMQPKDVTSKNLNGYEAIRKKVLDDEYYYSTRSVNENKAQKQKINIGL